MHEDRLQSSGASACKSRGVRKSFHAQPVLRGIDLDVARR